MGNRPAAVTVEVAMDNIRTIGTIGAGKIGTAVARLAIAAGYDVVLSNSRGPETLADLVAELGPKASADSSVGAATRGDLVVVTIPLRAVGEVPVEPLAGKIVVDTNNYYSARDGHIAELDDQTGTSAGLLQRHLPSSHVVKAFNHIQAEQLEADGTPAGTADRRALALFGDDADAVDTVGRWLDELGYDAVPGGPLAESWRIEPGTPGYGPRLDADGLRRALADATR
jgi:predicted dinucleotide-binding enzyme